jgi:hypothetical protein
MAHLTVEKDNTKVKLLEVRLRPRANKVLLQKNSNGY